MKINYKKIAAITSSALMLGMTAGVAAAASYPAPFVESGVGNSAVVYGTGDGVSDTDSVQAANIHDDLKSYIDSDSDGTENTGTGETYDLYTTSDKIYLGDKIDKVKPTLTDSQLPNVLADSSFEGDVNADVTQRISIGSNPSLTFGNHPTSDDDPVVAIDLGTTASNTIWNDTISLSKSVDFTDSDSIGESLTIFGQEYTVGAGTTEKDLYLYESSQSISLSVGSDNPSSETVTVDGEDYTIELVGTDDSSNVSDARIKVTDSNGDSESKTVAEDDSKRIQGIDIAVNYASEDTALGSIKAEVSIGSNKVKLTNGNEVRVGSDEDIIEGTNVIESGDGWNDSKGFTIQIFAPDTDVDAIIEGGEFVDPVFGSIKMGFPELANGEDSDDRETIEIKNSGSEKATVTFTSHAGDEETINFYYNSSGSTHLADSTGDRIRVLEGQKINETRGDYVVVGNEELGHLLELKSIVNSTDGYSDDYVEFEDVMSGDRYTSDSATEEGTASLMIDGQEYDITYVDDKSAEGDEYVILDYPDSDDNDKVIYPSIETSKGAKLSFYEPLELNLTDGSSLKFPDGNGYTDVGFTDDGDSVWSIAVDDEDTEENLDTKSEDNTVDFSIGELDYQLNSTGEENETRVYLKDTDSEIITNPAITLIGEEDDSQERKYHAQIVTMEGDGTSSNGIGVDDVESTYGSTWDNKQVQSDTDLYKDMDYWGTIVTTDKSESDQETATISYPDEQVYPKIYMGEASASSESDDDEDDEELGVLMVTDEEVDSVSDKNLIVVGGSCINSAAAALVGGSHCEEDFTDATDIGSGEYMIKGYNDSSITSELALLVAGYSSTDTTKAANYLTTETPDTSKSLTGTSAKEDTVQVDEDEE